MIEIISVFATVMIGLYAGSLLTEAMILVPYWKKMNSSDFLELHHSLGPNLFRYFAPLTTLAVGASVISAIFGTGWDLIAAALCIAALVIFFLYFRKANASFASGELSHEALKPELSRWEKWHWIRTIFVVLALAASATS